MPYTLAKFFLWGLLMALAGGGVGWLLRSLSYRGKVPSLRAGGIDPVEVDRLRGRVANLEPIVIERDRLRKTADQLFARARSPDGVYGTLSPEVQAELEQQASDDADLFQRSSSCVEGRNGQLSLTHHGLHRLSSRKLQALTVLHNYLIRRADGTTAAERFYGSRPRDLFPWLLDRLMHPARPRPRCRAA